MARKHGGRYGALLTAFAAVLAFGAIYSIATMFGAVIRKPALAREGSDAFLVKNAAAIRPGLSAYQRFAGADAAWRAINAPPVNWRTLESSAGDWEWHASARQVATDSAYALEQAGNAPGAIAVLARWVTEHPSDADALLDLARLENATGRSYDAVQHYRQLLALRPQVVARAELAKMLLDGGQYTEAAREYRRLLEVDSTQYGWHLGLAQALAWGDRPRDAQPVLFWLVARNPADTVVRALVRSTRAAYEPSVAEAAGWVGSEPGYQPYRVAYATALARSHDYRAAAAQYDTLLARGDTSFAALREAAGLHGLAHDSLGAAALLARAVARVPADDSLRLEYARTLSWAGDRTGAIREYSILIEHRPAAALFLARGQQYAWGGDYPHAAPDLRESARLHPTYDAYALLGDVYRWTGKFNEAKAAYASALQIRPADPQVLLALADIERSERIYGAAAGAGERGWTVASDYAEDNAGFLFLSAGVTRGFALDRRTTVSFGADQRRIAQRYWNRPTQWVDGFEANVGLSRQVTDLLELHGTAGVAEHAMVGGMAIGSLGGAWTYRGVTASVDLSRGPVYRSLMSLPTIAPAARSGFVADPTRALVGQSTAAAVTLPISRARITVGAERLGLSDGNRRLSLNVSARLPITSHVSALYSGGTLGYARPSAVYWDPSRYSQHMVGLEVSAHPLPSVDLSVRALPGMGRSVEMLAAAESTGTRATLPSHTALQLETGGNLTWRARSNLAVDAALGYGRGRAGSYQSMNGTLRMRWNW